MSQNANKAIPQIRAEAGATQQVAEVLAGLAEQQRLAATEALAAKHGVDLKEIGADVVER